MIMPLEEAMISAELLAIEREHSVVMLALDSAAYAHVCPEKFAPHVDLEGKPSTRGAFVADGRFLKELGTRIVLFVAPNRVLLEVTFKVLPISRPLLSVGQLLEQGYSLQLSASVSWLWRAT